MIEKVRKNAGLTSQYSAAITQLDKGRILRFRLLRDGAPMVWIDGKTISCFAVFSYQLSATRHFTRISGRRRRSPA